MELNEYHTKQIFERSGLPILRGKIAYTPDQVRHIVEDLSLKSVWLKPQVMSPAPIYTSIDLQDNYLANSSTEAEQKSMLIFGDKVPNRSNPFYATIQRVYVEEFLSSDPFCQLVIRVDFEHRTVTFSIKNNQNQMMSIFIHNQKMPLKDFEKIILFMKIRNPIIKKSFHSIINKTLDLFYHYGAMAVELNPIVKYGNRLIIQDGRLIFDPDNLFRFPELEKLREIKLGYEREALAKKNGFRYTSLMGNIACLSNGIGLGWATLDLLTKKGGTPACLLDVGTKPNEKSITTAIKLALSEPNVDALLINIFGGLIKCSVIARGILDAAAEISVGLPIIVRMVGLDQETGEKMLQDSIVPFRLHKNIDTAIQDVIRQSQGEK